MARRHTADTWWWVLVVLLVLWPVMMIFMMPGGPAIIGPFWFWLVLIVCLWILLGDRRATARTRDRRDGSADAPRTGAARRRARGDARRRGDRAAGGDARSFVDGSTSPRTRRMPACARRSAATPSPCCSRTTRRPQRLC